MTDFEHLKGTEFEKEAELIMRCNITHDLAGLVGISNIQGFVRALNDALGREKHLLNVIQVLREDVAALEAKAARVDALEAGLEILRDVISWRGSDPSFVIPTGECFKCNGKLEHADDCKWVTAMGGRGGGYYP